MGQDQALAASTYLSKEPCHVTQKRTIEKSLISRLSDISMHRTSADCTDTALRSGSCSKFFSTQGNLVLRGYSLRVSTSPVDKQALE